MGLLDKLWDDVVAGPTPDRGLGRLRNKNAKAGVPGAENLTGMDGEGGSSSMRDKKYRRSSTMVTQSINIRPPPLIRSASLGDESTPPSTPTGSVGSPSSMAGSPGAVIKDNVWRSVFHPGGGRARAMDGQGSARYDNVTPNSPSVYDWMYSPESKNKWHHP